MPAYRVRLFPLVHSACTSGETSPMPSLTQITSAVSNCGPSTSLSAFSLHGSKTVSPSKMKMAQVYHLGRCGLAFRKQIEPHFGRAGEMDHGQIARFCNRAIETSASITALLHTSPVIPP